MPRQDSGPEMELRCVLHRLGLRYRVHRRDLPGTPDVAFGPARVAVFVDGCFWHACPDHGVLPRNNRAWWRAKLEATRERDHRKDEDLRSLGWLPVHVWEHEDPEEAAFRIRSIVEVRRGR